MQFDDSILGHIIDLCSEKNHVFYPWLNGKLPHENSFREINCEKINFRGNSETILHPNKSSILSES